MTLILKIIAFIEVQFTKWLAALLYQMVGCFFTETSSGSAGILSLHFAKRKMGRMILNNALRAIVNAEKRGKATVELQPISTVMSSFLRIMKNRGYIKDFQVFEPHRVGKITVQLQGRVNDCRALTYRQDVKARDIEEYKMRKLPTHQWGYVVITTPEGVMDHEEAVTRNVGGQVLGYFH